MYNGLPGEIPTIVALAKVPPLGDGQENMRLIKWNQSSRNLGIFVPPGRRVYCLGSA